MDPEQAEKGQQQPGETVVYLAFVIADIRLSIHSRDKEKIDNPANKKQAEGEKVDCAANLFPVVETVGTKKSQNPEQIANQ